MLFLKFPSISLQACLSELNSAPWLNLLGQKYALNTLESEMPRFYILGLWMKMNEGDKCYFPRF